MQEQQPTEIFSVWGNKNNENELQRTNNQESAFEISIGGKNVPKFFDQLCDIEDCVDWMHDQKLKSYETFLEAVKLGNSICRFTKEENIEGLDNLLKENSEKIRFMTPYIEEAFEHILSLRFNEMIEYYLERGLSLDNDAFNDCLIILTKTARLFPQNPPSDTLEILLKYGADPNQIEKEHGKWRTPLHLSAKYGICEFVRILLQNRNIEVNSVDGLKKTPLNYADEMKSNDKNYMQIYKMIEKCGGNLDWKY